MAEHLLSAQPTHPRWNRSLEPRLEIASGDNEPLFTMSAAMTEECCRKEAFPAIVINDPDVIAVFAYVSILP
jgi:hypothetical protein